MKKSIFFILAMSLLCSVFSQTATDFATDFGMRLSGEIEKKIAPKIRLKLEEEVRLDNNFSSFDRFHTTLMFRYSPIKHIKVGVGYALINPYSSSSHTFKSARHRVMIDVSGSVKIDNFTFSLKERLQMTHRSGSFNTYQNPTNAWTLKSRIMAKYTALPSIKPFIYYEIRHYLNAPTIVANYNGSEYLTDSGSESGDAGWFLDGFNGLYYNRMRGCIGVDYRIDKRQTITISLYADYINDKIVDANSTGTILKSYTKENAFVGNVCLSYKYSL